MIRGNHSWEVKMAYNFTHRGVHFIIGHDEFGQRQWAIYPPGATGAGDVQGISGHRGSHNSFRAAKDDAIAAIDAWLEGKRPLAAASNDPNVPDECDTTRCGA